MANAIRPDHNNLYKLAEFAAFQLSDEKLSADERGLAARRLRPLISAILVTETSRPRDDCPTCVQPVIEQITKAALCLLDLGDAGYDLADAKAKLAIAYDLIGTLGELASSDAIEIVDKVPLIEAAETLINPALRVVALLTDPDRVEFVSDTAIRVGFSAISIVLQASAIATDKARELRQSRTTIH